MMRLPAGSRTAYATPRFSAFGVCLSAPFRFPSAGASAGPSLTSPQAAAAVAGQATGAVGPLDAGRYADPDGSVGSDPALYGDRSVAKDKAIADLNAIAIRAVTGPAI